MLTIRIEPQLIQATVEAMEDLTSYYESDACALARLDSTEARTLAQERLESAEVARGLSDFYAAL